MNPQKKIVYGCNTLRRCINRLAGARFEIKSQHLFATLWLAPWYHRLHIVNRVEVRAVVAKAVVAKATGPMCRSYLGSGWVSGLLKVWSMARHFACHIIVVSNAGLARTATSGISAVPPCRMDRRAILKITLFRVIL